MTIHEHTIRLAIEAPYYALGEINAATTHLWMAFHGYGQQARHFVRRMDVVPENHVVLAPQGLSRFYLDKEYKHIGASWATREYISLDKLNLYSYLDAVLIHALDNQRLDRFGLNILGFSQGVSAAMRWLVARRLQPSLIILWAGSIPAELEAQHFAYLDPTCPVYYVHGTEDPIITPQMVETHSERLHTLFGKRLNIVAFEGKHEMKRETLSELMSRPTQLAN